MPIQQPNEQSTLSRVKVVLRSVVQVEEDAEICDDMPLKGGEFDMDSLDLLLLIGAIEKEFAIKIDNEQVDLAAFESVATLARFVDSMTH
jgi:3-hydroxyacyl-[acyl-carrier-protein] dehydratase